MSLLGSLGLVKDVPAPATAPVIPVTPVAAPVKAGRRKTTATVDDSEDDATPAKSASTSAGSGTVSKDIVKRLRKALANSGGDGFDFVKFSAMLTKNSKLDESTNYQTALSAAEAMGVSSDELISSAANAKKAVNNESKKIDADLAEQEEKNTSDQDELKKVNAQIASLQAKKEELEQTIKDEGDGIKDSKDNLESSTDEVIQEITDTVAKIKQYSK